ncbi:MAG: plasmid pRiA4b ORF-3 family protein [Cyclobacteriaceae bacterium]|nr:plasmid pRiA4b ORF-3 family protein [Cyclobacteriaceae bacterium]
MNITEISPTPILKDFESFMSYFESNKIKVSEKTEHFSNKVLNEVNRILEKGVQNPPKSLRQEGYTMVLLFYHISLVSGLANIAFVNNKSYFEVLPRFEDFLKLLPIEKYMFLLEAFWVHCDLNMISNSYFQERSTQDSILFLSPVCKEIETGKSDFYPDNDRYQHSFRELGTFIECLSFFGFCDFEIDPDHEFATLSRRVIKRLWITEFGMKILPVLNRNRNLSFWNVSFRIESGEKIDFPGQKNSDYDIGGFLFESQKYSKTSSFLKPEPFHKAYKSLLPGMKDIAIPVIPYEEKVDLGRMILNVYFTTKIYRKIAMSSDSTLEELHWIIQEAFDFDNDHLYAFFMDGKPWSHNAYNSPDGSEGPFTDEVTLGELKLKPGKKILYLFDYGDEWRFNVVLKKVDPIEKPLKAPIILESIGDAPEQYPDYEEDW